MHDSKAAIFAVHSNSLVSSNILDCARNCYRVCLSTLSIQWIPGHCGVTGNEFADHPAKKGASIQQITTRAREAVPFTSAKRIIMEVPDYFRNRDFTNAYKWVIFDI
ncbi:hypothetical protein TNCV_1483881 [Trichonephila clavipes]|nr:hypothetical protein TNCV_1483881 [Trichonephila clavipes]